MRVSSDDLKLARIFLNHSLKIKPKEKVLISVSNYNGNPFVKALFIEILKLGAYPLLDIARINYFRNRAELSGLTYEFYQVANEWQLNYIPEEILKATVDWADAFINIVFLENTRELAQIDTKKLMKRSIKMEPLVDKIIDSDRWVLTYFPTQAMAQDAGVSLQWLIDFYYKSCLVDYQKMKKDLLKLEKVLDNGKTIHLVGQNTDLTLGIEGRLAKACYGERNIPDGEAFLAPIKNSTNGHVFFELPSNYAGREISNIYLEFKDGKVVKALADQNQDALEDLLNTDDGARFLGEFAIGANYNISQVMKETLFDEKIGGTVHMALGRSYKEKRGGASKGANESAIHWDIVKDTRIKGSYVEVDGEKVLQDGKILV